MLTIRKSQMDVLESAAIRTFEDRTYRHLQRYFPGHCALLGEEQMRRVIQHGWTKAKHYDLTAECCARSYIEFMCLLGGGFDVDPLLPWAADILNDRTSSDQVARGDRLYDRAWEYITHIIPDYRDSNGQPTTARFVDELRELRGVSDDVLTPASMPRFALASTERLQKVFPAKCDYVGGHAVRGLILTAAEAAKGYGITGERGVLLFAVLRFVLGGGFDKDPLLPWAAEVLHDEAIMDEGKRVDRLYAEGVHMLRRWWDAVPTQEA